MEIVEVVTDDPGAFLRLHGKDVDGNPVQMVVTDEGIILDVFVDDEDGNEVVFTYAREFSDLLEMTV